MNDMTSTGNLTIMKQMNITVNTLRPRQNGRHFPDDIFKCIFLTEHVSISINIWLKFVPKCPINNIPALVQIMAWRRPGDKPLSEPMMVCLPTHICVTRPQWVNRELSWHPHHCCGSSSDDKVGIMITLGFQCYILLKINQLHMKITIYISKTPFCDSNQVCFIRKCINFFQTWLSWFYGHEVSTLQLVQVIIWGHQATDH